MRERKYDLVIVGGGASGLAAAIFAARFYEGWRIVLLEKQPRVGKKLLSTGNGTCNLSNRNANPTHYHGACASFVRPALTQFSPKDATVFFHSLGVPCELRENGRVYPQCANAAAVLDCMRLEVQARRVEVRCACAATSLKQSGDGWTVTTSDGERIETSRTLVATGGAASPTLGGSSEGYALLTALGHAKTPLFPSIVQVKTDTTFVRAVKGLRVEAAVRMCLEGKEIAREEGEVLFTEYGLSGPAVMQVSRVAGDWERQKKGTLTARLDLLPSVDEKQLTAQLILRAKRLSTRSLEDFLTGIFQRRIGQTILRVASIGPLTRLCGELSEDELAKLARTVKTWELPVVGTQGFGGAQVTAGGIRTDECDPLTMESRKAKNLYICGEILDVDGDCGGYNLQWAWASAYTAVQAMGRGSAQ